MFGALATGVKDLGFRFTVSAFLPFLLLVAVGFALVAVVTYAPASPPRAVVDAASGLGPASGVALLVVSFVLAVVSQPFQVALVRLVEGYWGVSTPAVAARAVGVEMQRRRCHRLQVALLQATVAGERDEAAYLRQRLVRYPPDPRDLLPTLLGNTLRAGERSAGERYGLDTVRAWSRLYYLLPEPFQKDVADLHGQVDGAARLTIVFGIAGAASLPVLAPHGWWNLASLAALALAVVAYRGGVTAATGLGAVLAACFDLNRFRILEAMRLPHPKDIAQEREANAQVDGFLSGRKVDPLLPGQAYRHI